MAGTVGVDTKDIAADGIDGDFVAQPRADVVGVEIDEEAILLLEGTRELHALNPTGTLVWGLLDGVSTLEAIVADLTAAFDADPEVIRNDVVEVTRQFGRAGLLIGVAREDPAPPPPPSPQGLPAGTELESFTYPTLDGDPVALEDLKGKQFLLVNWSPRCGYCVRIAPELAELEPELTKREVDLVLLTIGEADENRELVESHELRCTVLLQDGGYSAFAGLGTPAAYMIDEDGKVSSELALGAIEVPVLARQTAS
jgi:peroxiredoxin